jgi:hypothetical protein
VRFSASGSLCGLLLLGLGLVLGCHACGKSEPGAAAPHGDVAPVAPVEPVTDPSVDVGADVGPAAPAEPARPRVDLVSEFHRTRIGRGGGFWVLGVITNPHKHAVTDARAQVQLLDAEGEIVSEVETRASRLLAAEARVAVAVLVSEPVEHEQLQLLATGVASEAPTPASLPLKLEHEPPQRAELGGWFVVGQVTNTGGEPIEGARLEIQGLDRAGQLLGVDWLVLDVIAPDETIEFDVGDLRYEEPPATFTLKLRRPIS